MWESARVEFFGPDGSHFIVNGAGASRKLFLSPDIKGIYDAPVQTRRKSSAFQKGSTYLGKSYKERRITFGVDIKGDTPEEWQQLQDDWNSIWDYEPDPWDPDSTLTKMSITTPISGTRSLWLAKDDTVEFESKHDPHITRSSRVPMAVVADQPFFFEDKWENSPYDYFETGSAGTSEGFVTISNPCDQPIWLQWVVTRGKWTLPDFSWRGKKHHRVPGGEWANRKITLPELTALEGGARITLYRDKLQVRDFAGTNLAGRMNGISFEHVVPPKTPETNLPVKVENAPVGGGRVEVYCQRRWGHAWESR
ncbi:Phage tail protein [Nocardia farcinica]|uniref:Phage tail n=1 Tax=Nocardia farcinica TaxID=37329 RepID=A0A0H5P956_NOCFR|nr:hypothetical protein [Nocardia farcinica]PFW98723.1 hypothetical protein CJ469_05976 [Nocardia farcinica]PFX04325.1 hypothetical protein CJ468_05571 [Nocardia farcinica]CRY84390.1 Uncharacterised protein [Nocardia farcinica]SIT34313.1 Phage tail protein [Nocardia farcinica]